MKSLVMDSDNPLYDDTEGTSAVGDANDDGVIEDADAAELLPEDASDPPGHRDPDAPSWYVHHPGATWIEDIPAMAASHICPPIPKYVLITLH